MIKAIRLGPLSMRLRLRMLVVTAACAVVAFFLLCVSISMGDYSISVLRIMEIITRDILTAVNMGRASDMLGLDAPTRVENLIVMERRTPRALIALLVGLGLGCSGAIVQSLTRNPLASPDILGISTGASLAAVAVVTGSGGFITTLLGGLGVSVAAMVGAALTAVAVYLLAWRGGVDGMRLVLIGVALTAALTAGVNWILIRAKLTDVSAAQSWIVGDLSGSTWDKIGPLIYLGLPLIAISLLVSFGLRVVALGDDAATALGVRLNLMRIILLGAAVVMIAVAVSAAGPIGFVAFVTPQIAMRLVGASTPPLLASAIVGALAVLLADIVARILPVSLPVGLVTAAVGGPFLVALVVATQRRKTR